MEVLLCSPLSLPLSSSEDDILHLDMSTSCFISGSFSMYVLLWLRSSPELLLRRSEREDVLLKSGTDCCCMCVSCGINLGSFQYSDSESESESSTVLLRWSLLKWKLFDLYTGM